MPTTAGTTLAIHARALLERADELRQAMDGLRGDSAHEIRLASNTSAVDTLTEFLAATLARFPTMRIAVVETSSVEVASRVREGGADLGIVSLPPTGDGLIARELWADPLVVVRGSVFRGDDVAPSFEEVMRGPLIGLPAANPLQTLIDEQARILGVFARLIWGEKIMMGIIRRQHWGWRGDRPVWDRQPLSHTACCHTSGGRGMGRPPRTPHHSVYLRSVPRAAGVHRRASALPG